jgi:CHAD domain-containing protein
LASITSVPSQIEPQSVPDQTRFQLEKMLRARLRKCIALLPKVLGGDDPDPVHDLRVWTRRLQQVIAVLFPKPAPAEARAITRTVKRARHQIGDWRDCDVLIDIVGRKLKRIHNSDERDAWAMVRQFVENRRAREVRRARRKIANRNLFTLVQKGERLLAREASSDEPLRSHAYILIRSIREGYDRWGEALARALETNAAPDIHAFRIATKRLRYRIELARDLGSPSASEALDSLVALQDELGRWHDGVELARMVAEALADPEFLLNHPRTAATVLQKTDRAINREHARIHEMLSGIRAGSVVSLAGWIESYCRDAAPDSSHGNSHGDTEARGAHHVAVASPDADA